MKNIRIRILLIVCVLAVVAGAASLAARDSRGQSRPAKTAAPMPAAKSELVKPTVLVTDRTPVKPATSTFTEAATQNTVLRNELIWTFGSKPQHGWFLYDLLIGQTLNAPPDSTTNDFTSAVAVWQKQKGLSANGVLDEHSWIALIARWRGSTKDKTPALRISYYWRRPRFLVRRDCVNVAVSDAARRHAPKRAPAAARHATGDSRRQKNTSRSFPPFARASIRSSCAGNRQTRAVPAWR